MCRMPMSRVGQRLLEGSDVLLRHAGRKSALIYIFTRWVWSALKYYDKQ